MNCEQARPLIDPYADGELGAATILELEKHLHDCSACSLSVRNVQNLKKAVNQDALFFPAPAELRRRIKTELRSQIGNTARGNLRNWNWLTAAITGVATACIALLFTLARDHRVAQQGLAEQVVSDHIRSLMGSHLLDVTSSDQHTVKPWFNGKIDFSPPVKELAAQNFPLIGGRLDYVAGRSVAALVYQRQKHFINLFIWPAKEMSSEPVMLSPVHGYHVIDWSETGMVLWAVSDLNEKELMEFVQAFANAKAMAP